MASALSRIVSLGGALVAVAFAMMIGGCTGSTTLTQTPPHSAPVPFVHPGSVKVVVVVLENKDADEVHGDAYSFLNGLAQTGADFHNFYGIAHPSQHNYVALISGSTNGIDGDDNSTVTRNHLGRALSHKGMNWKCYAEDYPHGRCFLDDTLDYVRKHVPFLSFADVQDDPAYCSAHITDVAEFVSDARDGTLPEFSMVIPNLENDAHDPPLSPSTALKAADDWLGRVFDPLLRDSTFRRDVVLVVTFDEDGSWPFPSYPDDDNRIYTVFWGEHVVPGPVNDVYDHYDLLRTFEMLFGLPAMAEGDSCATAIGGVWK